MKIDLRKIFDDFNAKLENKLNCEKLYIVPAMKYWVDGEEMIMAMLQLGDNPYTIKSIRFNPYLSEKEMIEILKKYIAEAMTLGNHWEEYVTYKKLL